jgi:hypothetical protein
VQIHQLLLFAVALCSQGCGGQVASDPSHAGGGSGTGGSTPAVGGRDAVPGTGGRPIGDFGGAPAASGGAWTATGGASAATGGTDPCLGYTFCYSRPPLVLTFTVDTSSAMGFTNAPSTAGRTKWEMTRELLHGAFASLPAAWEVGATLFDTETTQTVPIQPLTSEQRARLDDVLDSVVPQGGMPLLAGYTLGMNQLLSVQATGGRYSDAWLYNVLVVDGVPTVNRDGTPGTGMNRTISQEEYEFAIRAVALQTLNTRIKTFVFGVPGSDDPQGAPYDPLYQLSQLAVAGATATLDYGLAPGTVERCYDSTNQRESTCLVSRGSYCHQDLTTDPDIAGRLESVLAFFSSSDPCGFYLPRPEGGARLDAEATRLVYTSGGRVPSELRRSLDDCSTGDWTLKFMDPTLQVFYGVLCPGMCDALTAPGGGGCVDVITRLEPGSGSGTPVTCTTVPVI